MGMFAFDIKKYIPFSRRSYTSLNLSQEKALRTKLRFVYTGEKPKAKHPCFSQWWQCFVTIKSEDTIRSKKRQKSTKVD
jgi:hypothetical protein